MTTPSGSLPSLGSGAGAQTGLIGTAIDPQYDLAAALGFSSTTPDDQKTLVYSPDVRVWVARGGKQYDVSQDVVGGSVLRKENSASSIVIRLANKELRYNGLFHRMDRVTVFLKRIKWYQVFSGYLDSVPLWRPKAGVVTLRATCTIKRLKYTYWDPGLSDSQALLQSQWNLSQTNSDGQGELDSGLGSLLARVLHDVGGWDYKNLHIQEIPKTFTDFLSASIGKMSEQNKKATDEFRRLLLGAGDTSGGVGASAGREYNTTSGSYNVVGGQAGYIAEIIAACDERSLGPKLNDVTTGQDIRKAGEEGVTANQGNINKTSDDTPAWEHVAGIGTQYEQAAKDSDAAILGVATALVESNLRMLANPAVPESMNFPHDGVGTDHDSVGLFQQRSSGWGTVSQRMNARASAGMFFNKLMAFDWRNMEPGSACQRVQVSAFPDRYAQRIPEATQLVQAYRTGQQTTTSAPVAQGISSVNGVVGASALTGLGGPTQTPSGPGETAGSLVGKPNPDSEDAIRWMMMQLGKPYIWGATGPSGYDCSGLTTMGFRSIGLDIGRDTYAQAAHGQAISPSMIKRGDLVFPTSGHVVVWMGDGTILDAPQSGDVVRIAPAYFNPANVYAIRRYCDNGGPASTPAFNDPFLSGPGLPPATGVGTGLGSGIGASGTVGGSSEPIARNLFSYMFEHGTFQSKTSNMFEGEKAYINDEPLLQIVQTLVKAGLRNFQSAPNGDFVAYYPDYFGLDGKQAILQLEEVEMKDVGIDFNDDSLATHVYVAGDHQFGQGIPVNEYGWLETCGVATVENPFLFGALTAMSIGFPEQMDGQELMRRFGVRPFRQEFTSIASKELEFLVACQIFMLKWAQQFATQVEFTFMPELFPGMRIQLAGYNMQAYVTEVSHTFDFEDGFSTSAVIMAPSNPNIKKLADNLGFIYRNFIDQTFGGVLKDIMDGL